MDVDDYITRYQCSPVSSHQIFEASTTKLHPDGLFSEEIFGEIGSDLRLIKFGYIDLHTEVFHPQIYTNIVTMKGLYKDIMSSKVYAKYDDEVEDLIACTKDEIDAGTGYDFFIKNFHRIKFKQTNSLKRDIKIRIFEKYKDLLTIKKCLVLPAGLRDLEEEADGRMSSADINKLYNSLLSLSLAMPPDMGDHPIFNSLRFNIQAKVYEIYQYIKNLVEGKRGFGQGKYMARRLAFGTRNVISSAIIEGESPDDPKYLKHNETLVPLFQAIKMYQPIVQYYLRLFFYRHVFDTNTNKVAGINPKSFHLEYFEVSDIEKNKYTTDEGLDLFIARYLDEDKREKPVAMYDVNKSHFYLALVLDLGDTIYITRNAEEFCNNYNELHPDAKVYPRDLRPLTLIELMYMTAYPSLKHSHMLNVRYPVTHIESIYPSKVHLATTRPGRTVEFHSIDDESSMTLPEYPIFGAQHVDAMALHHSWLSNLTADHDGDMGNGTGIISKTANDEIEAYMNSPASMVNTRGEFIVSINSRTLIPYVFYNMSMRRIKQTPDLTRFRPAISRVRYANMFKDMMPIHECLILGSAFLALLGLTKNEDLDCITTDHIFDIIGSSPKFVYDPKRNEYHTENREISVWHDYLGYTFDDLSHTALVIDSLHFVHPKILYEFYSSRNKEKDKEHMALMKKYIPELLK